MEMAVGVSASGFLDDCVHVRACGCFHFSTWIAASPHTVAVIPLTSCSSFPQATEIVSGINGESGGRKASKRARRKHVRVRREPCGQR